jgi:hypothetical protein
LLDCRQIGGGGLAEVASRTPLQPCAGFGGFQRSGPTGGSANGTPRHWREWLPMSSHRRDPSPERRWTTERGDAAAAARWSMVAAVERPGTIVAGSRPGRLKDAFSRPRSLAIAGPVNLSRLTACLGRCRLAMMSPPPLPRDGAGRRLHADLRRLRASQVARIASTPPVARPHHPAPLERPRMAR